MTILNESYRAVLSGDLLIMLYKVVLTFEVMDEILKFAVQMKDMSSTLL